MVFEQWRNYINEKTKTRTNVDRKRQTAKT